MKTSPDMFFSPRAVGKRWSSKKASKNSFFSFWYQILVGWRSQVEERGLIVFFVDSGCDCLYHCHTFLWDVGTLVSWTADSRIYAFCTNHTRCLVLVGWERQEKWKATKTPRDLQGFFGGSTVLRVGLLGSPWLILYELILTRGSRI